MKRLWWICIDILKGIKIWFADIPCIIRWGREDFKKKKDDDDKKKHVR